MSEREMSEESGTGDDSSLSSSSDEEVDVQDVDQPKPDTW